MIMDIFELYYLPIIIFIGLITSYEDTKYHKIRNLWIAISIGYSLIVLSLAIASTGIINKDYIITFFWNLAISAIMAFLLWHISLWSAGDGKLFIAYSALVPVTVYEIGSIVYFPSYAILVNTFLPLFIFYLAKALKKSNIKQKMEIIKSISIRHILYISLIVLSLHSITYTLFRTINLKEIYSIITSSILILFILQNIKKNYILKILILLATFNIIINFEKIATINFLYSTLLLIIFVIFMRFFIAGLAFNIFTESVKISDLKPGMYLAAKPHFKTINDSVNQKTFLQKKTPFLFRSFELKKENIEKLKKFYKDGKLSSDYVKIYQKVPFAPAMFIGVIVTIISRGSLLSLIKILIESFI